jgi:DNA topoisomerase-1
MNLLIVESPAKAGTINKYLGNNYKVLASFGHIRDLPSKTGSVDPNNNFSLIYDVDARSQKHLKAISDSVKNIDKLILATDPDREGESISWHIVEALKERNKLRNNIKIERVVFNEITKPAILKAIENPRDIDMNLVDAQQARRVLDYLVGFTLSPILWRKLPGSKSAGRVQSVALRLICERELEIEKFNPIEYWSIDAEFLAEKEQILKAKLIEIWGEKIDKFHLKNTDDAKRIEADSKQKSYSVAAIKSKKIKRKPYAPFTTSTLQQEAANKLGFTAKSTMMIAQKLYEGVNINGETKGLITYMRTDGISISKEAIKAIRNLIKSKYGERYLPEKEILYKSKIKNAQEAHEAIRPTDITIIPEDAKKYLSEEQFKLYNLIWKRTISSQMTEQESEQTSLDILAHDKSYNFRASGTVVLFKGFSEVYGNFKETDENLLPELQEGNHLNVKEILANQHFTEPPPRYNEASLVKTLEELGIGRPSTYASIISILIDRNYAHLDKKRFVPENRGLLVNSFLVGFFEKYFEYDFTANLEEGLDDISNGKIEWKDFLAKFWKGFSKISEEIGAKEAEEITKKITDSLAGHFFGSEKEGRKCTSCANGELSLRMGKFGAFIACSNYPECKYTRQIGDNNENEIIENNDQIIAKDDSGNEIKLKKGPYGFYLEILENEKAKRISIPKFINIDELNDDIAKKLVKLPRSLGVNPESNKEIKVNNGKYGPYLMHDGAFLSIDNNDLLTIKLDKALDLLKNSKKTAAANIIGVYEKTKDEIKLMKGRYGPYIKLGKKNIAIPKNFDADAITLAQAIEIIDKKL